jgi:hypothetical protein
MRTPLFFSPAEGELLRGTSVFGATQDTERKMREEYELLAGLLGFAREGEKAFSWFVRSSFP